MSVHHIPGTVFVLSEWVLGAQSCPTLRPMGYSSPGTSVTWNSQGRAQGGGHFFLQQTFPASSLGSPALPEDSLPSEPPGCAVSHLCVILILGQVVTHHLRQGQQRSTPHPGPMRANLSLTAPKAETGPGARAMVQAAFQPALCASGHMKSRGTQFSSGALKRPWTSSELWDEPQISGGIWKREKRQKTNWCWQLQ